MSAQTLQTLVNSMANGWRVESPVYFRKRWHPGAANKAGYYFILTKGGDTDLIILPDDEQVQKLISTQRLTVVLS